MADFYSKVPKLLSQNLAYRLDLRKRAAADAGFRRAVLTACKHDVLYWMSAWCFVYEPRVRFGPDGRQLPKTIPFIPWTHQAPVIREIKANLGIRDIGVSKSRGEGMSWIGILLALHDWLFDPGSKIGLVSNTEKKADDPGNMDSLGAKVDWELTKLPSWMVPRFKRNQSDHSWVNESNFSQINAFAATSDAGRGGRYKWFLPDELAFWERGQDSRFMASIRGATESRLVISTPNGSDGEYFSFMHSPSGNLVTLTLDWKDNPTRNRGLYQILNNRAVAIHPLENPLLPEYAGMDQSVLDLWSRLRRKGFVLEKRHRSPWYDGECDRADSTPQSIAQELDRDFGGSMFKYFLNDFTEQANKHVRPPTMRGMLSYHPETLKPEFDTSGDGQVLLWCQLNAKRQPPSHQYVVGADVSAGLGGSYTSNSVAQVIDLTTGEQVAEYATNTMPPVDFADFCISLAIWFHNARLIWEHNGPGPAFTKRVRYRQYGNAYRRKLQFKNSVKNTSDLGWWTTRDTKELMFGEFRQAVKAQELVLHSNMLVGECGQYVVKGGKIQHVLTADTEDETGKGEAHGDRVVACCIAYQGVKERPLMSTALAKQTQSLDSPPIGTLAWREKYHDDLLRQDNDPWDQRTTDDLAAGGRFREGF